VAPKALSLRHNAALPPPPAKRKLPTVDPLNQLEESTSPLTHWKGKQMSTVTFDAYSPFRSLILNNVRVQVERAHGGYLVVYQGQCSGLQETIREAVEVVASEVHDCQINVTRVGRG
jgi:hypothetical protein